MMKIEFVEALFDVITRAKTVPNDIIEYILQRPTIDKVKSNLVRISKDKSFLSSPKLIKTRKKPLGQELVLIL